MSSSPCSSPRWVSRAYGFHSETARLGAANACRPFILGWHGRTMEAAALLAKRQLLRISLEGETQALREMEREALERVNALGIGPMGLGGNLRHGRAYREIPMHSLGSRWPSSVQCHCDGTQALRYSVAKVPCGTLARFTAQAAARFPASQEAVAPTCAPRCHFATYKPPQMTD
jgi:hypothetical protein